MASRDSTTKGGTNRHAEGRDGVALGDMPLHALLAEEAQLLQGSTITERLRHIANEVGRQASALGRRTQ